MESVLNNFARQGATLGTSTDRFNAAAAVDYNNRAKLAAADIDNVQLSVARSRDEVGELVSRLSRLADRLCGPVLQHESTAGGKPPVASGVFPEIEASCGNINAFVSAGYASLDRIEKHLPTTAITR